MTETQSFVRSAQRTGDGGSPAGSKKVQITPEPQGERGADGLSGVSISSRRCRTVTGGAYFRMQVVSLVLFAERGYFFADGIMRLADALRQAGAFVKRVRPLGGGFADADGGKQKLFTQINQPKGQRYNVQKGFHEP